MKNTNYNMKVVHIALADWYKLKDALAAFIRANYTDYSFDDAIKKEGEYLALEEYIYGRTYRMCSTYAWCNDHRMLFTTKDEAAFKASTDPMAWMQNRIERLSERDENLERDLQREASIDKYRAERVAYYEKAKEPEIEKYKSFKLMANVSPAATKQSLSVTAAHIVPTLLSTLTDSGIPMRTTVSVSL